MGFFNDNAADFIQHIAWCIETVAVLLVYLEWRESRHERLRDLVVWGIHLAAKRAPMGCLYLTFLPPLALLLLSPGIAFWFLWEQLVGIQPDGTRPGMSRALFFLTVAFFAPGWMLLSTCISKWSLDLMFWVGMRIEGLRAPVAQRFGSFARRRPFLTAGIPIALLAYLMETYQILTLWLGS